MERYDVYEYNIPTVSPEGTAIPVVPSQTRDFSDVEEAKSFAAKARNDFSRVVVMCTSDAGQHIVEGYADGHYVNQPATRDSLSPG